MKSMLAYSLLVAAMAMTVQAQRDTIGKEPTTGGGPVEVPIPVERSPVVDAGVDWEVDSSVDTRSPVADELRAELEAQVMSSIADSCPGAASEDEATAEAALMGTFLKYQGYKKGAEKDQVDGNALFKSGTVKTCGICHSNSDCQAGMTCHKSAFKVVIATVVSIFDFSQDENGNVVVTADPNVTQTMDAIYNVEGHCIVPFSVPINGECCVNKQCEGSLKCQNDKCVCTKDIHCPDEHYCFNNPFGPNTCVKKKPVCESCANNSQCLSGDCNWFKCIVASVKSSGESCCRDKQCKDGMVCENGKCTCKQDSHCPSGQYCFNNPFGVNECRQKKPECDSCVNDSNCASGDCAFFKCVTASSLNAGNSCCRDKQCKSGMLCEGGKCVCKYDSHCGAGKYCKNNPFGPNTCENKRADCSGCINGSQCAGGLCPWAKCATANTRSSGQSCCRDVQCTSGNCKLNGKCQ